MKIKYLITAVILLSFSNSAFADAKNFLRNLESIKSIKADFVQVDMIDGFDDARYEGKVYIISKEKALWNYDNPKGTWYLFTKDKVIFYDSETDAYEEYEGNGITMLEILTDLTAINENFITTVSGNKLILMPKNNIDIGRIEIVITKDKISSISTDDGNGNGFTITFRNTVYNSKIDSEIFSKELQNIE